MFHNMQALHTFWCLGVPCLPIYTHNPLPPHLTVLTMCRLFPQTNEEQPRLASNTTHFTPAYFPSLCIYLAAGRSIICIVGLLRYLSSGCIVWLFFVIALYHLVVYTFDAMSRLILSRGGNDGSRDLGTLGYEGAGRGPCVWVWFVGSFSLHVSGLRTVAWYSAAKPTGRKALLRTGTP